MGLRSKTIAGIGVMGLLQAFQLCISFTTSIFLYRLLSARDFGVFVLCELYLLFAMAFADMGMETASIQNKESLFQSTYFIRIVFTLLGTGLLALGVAPLGRGSGFPEIITPLRILSITLLLQLLSFRAEIHLKKGMKFPKLFLPELCTVIVTSSCSLVLAFSGWGYWSLIWSALAGQTVRAFIFAKIYPPGPFPRPIRGSLIMLLASGWHIFLTGILFYLLQRTGHFLSGNFLGLETLGYFALAFNWSNVFVTRFVHLVGRVVFPAASSVAGEKARILKIYDDFLSKMSFLATPFHLGLAILGPLAIPAVLGEKWAASVPYFQVLCFYGYLRSMASVFHTLLQALGHFALIARLLFLEWGIYVVGGLIGLQYFNLWGVVIAMLVAKAIVFIFLIKTFLTQLNLRAGKSIADVIPSFIASLMMGGGILVLMRIEPLFSLPVYLSLTLILMIAVGIYLITYSIVFPKHAREMISFLKELRPTPSPS